MSLAAQILAGQSAEAIFNARQLARLRSIQALRRNLRRHDKQGLIARLIQGAKAAAKRRADRVRAKQVADAMAEHWRQAAKKVISPKKGPYRTPGKVIPDRPKAPPPRTVAKKVAKAEAYRTNMVAATEVSRAFNEEREDAFQVLAEEVDPKAEEQPWREWDATLDKRTCEICDRADGSMVRVGSKFRAGTPGKVHPNCRCLEQLVWMPRGFRGKDRSR